MCRKRHKPCFKVCGRIMSIISIENPNLARDVSLASGTNSTQVKPWLEEPKFSWRKELGEALVGCPQRFSVVRPEGKREPGKVQSQCWALGGGWEKRKIQTPEKYNQ